MYIVEKQCHYKMSPHLVQTSIIIYPCARIVYLYSILPYHALIFSAFSCKQQWPQSRPSISLLRTMFMYKKLFALQWSSVTDTACAQCSMRAILDVRIGLRLAAQTHTTDTWSFIDLIIVNGSNVFNLSYVRHN